MLAVDQVELFQIFQSLEPLRFQFGNIVFIIQRTQNSFMSCFCRSIFFIEIVQQVAYAQTVTADLVRISRADTLTGRTDFARTFRSLVSSIQYTVSRQDQMSFLRDTQLFGQVVSAGSECLRFLLEQQRIQYDTVTDNVYLASLENTGRDGT